MSMFYELMMRKKEETLYPVIKGSLTDTDGVISGFINTGANYLQIDNINKLSSVNSWEITIKIVNSSGSYFIGTNLERILTISAETSKLYLSSDGISWNIANGVGLNTAIPNDSYVRLRFTGTQYILDYSSDLTNWTNCATITSSTKISNAITSLVIGKWWTGNVNFTGSIDLNNSYIKIGATKYNLQAVVGYKVVGSPTITDGVVSGFSSANYLYLPSAPSWSNIDVLETFTTFTTSTMNTLQIVMGSRYSQATCCVEITSANKPLFRITYSDSGGTTKYKETTINYVLSANTKYKVKNYFNKQTLVIKSELYDENGIMLASESSSLASDYTFIANINDFWYGYNPQRGTFNGSIDLNNTYIKINNKLWFNGQQA